MEGHRQPRRPGHVSRSMPRAAAALACGSRSRRRVADDQGQLAGFVSCVVIVICDFGGARLPAAGACPVTNHASLSVGSTGPTVNPSATIFAFASPTVMQT